MEFLELAQKRYSCRKFLDKEVEKEKIYKILEAGRLAPTACNFQPQRILVVTDREKQKALKECTKFTFDAPVILGVCYDKEESWKRKYDGQDGGIVDASIVTTHMMLEIAQLELGSTWVGSFDPNKARNILNIPDNLEIVNLLPFGYPAEDGAESAMHNQRKTIEQIVSWNNFTCHIDKKC